MGTDEFVATVYPVGFVVLERRREPAGLLANELDVGGRPTFAAAAVAGLTAVAFLAPPLAAVLALGGLLR